MAEKSLNNKTTRLVFDLWAASSCFAKTKIVLAILLNIGGIATSTYSPVVFNKIVSFFSETQHGNTKSNSLYSLLLVYPVTYMSTATLSYITRLLVYEAQYAFVKETCKAGISRALDRSNTNCNVTGLVVGNRIANVSYTLDSAINMLFTSALKNFLELLVNGSVMLFHMSKRQVGVLSIFFILQYVLGRYNAKRKTALDQDEDSLQQEFNQKVVGAFDFNEKKSGRKKKAPLIREFEEALSVKLAVENRKNQHDQVSALAQLALVLISSGIIVGMSAYDGLSTKKENSGDFILMVSATVSFHLFFHFFKDIFVYLNESYRELDRFYDETGLKRDALCAHQKRTGLCLIN